MNNPFERTEMLIGADKIEILKKSSVAVFGIGGVGSYVAAALARSGIGAFSLFDHDTVAISNINRQLIAYHSTVGKYKVNVMKDIIKDINPQAVVDANICFLSKETIGGVDFSHTDYIVDAIDTVSSKILLIELAKRQNIPIISCMGAGNKLNPMGFKVADIEKTSVCPLAKVMRRELKALGIRGVKVVYSEEMPLKPAETEEKSAKRQIPGSMSYVPSAAGLIMAGAVIDDLLN